MYINAYDVLHALESPSGPYRRECHCAILRRVAGSADARTASCGGEEGKNRGGNVAAARTTERHLSDEDLARVIGLIKQSDTVELKVTVRQGDHISGVAALGMDPLDAQIRQVYFFDTPALTLYHHGVVVRARRVQKKGDDSVV